MELHKTPSQKAQATFGPNYNTSTQSVAFTGAKQYN